MASLSVDDQISAAESALGSAIQEWQRRTGYYPFLVQRDGSGNDVATLRTFDPPGPERSSAGIFPGIGNMGGSRKLFTPGGFISVTSLVTDISRTSPGGSQTLVENDDFWCKPLNATAMGRPYTYIEFRSVQYGNPASIGITAMWGFTNAIDATVFRAILRGAAAEAADPGVLARFGGMVQWTEDQTQEVYGQNPNASVIERCRETFERAVTSSQYRKLVVA